MATRARIPDRTQPSRPATGWRRAGRAWRGTGRADSAAGGDLAAGGDGASGDDLAAGGDGASGDDLAAGGDGAVQPGDGVAAGHRVAAGDGGTFQPDDDDAVRPGAEVLGQRPDGWTAPGPTDDDGNDGLVSDRWRPWAEVALVVVCLAVQVGITALAGRHQPERRDLDVFGVALLAAGVLALPWRRARPVATLAVAFGATVTYWSADYPRGPVFLALIAALGQAVLAGHRRAAVTFLVAGFVGFPWLGAWLGTTEGPELGGLIALAAWLVTLITVMELVRSRRDRAREAARSRAEALQRRATDERMRIARELHDAVAHRMSLVSIQAGVALHLFDAQPEQARQALATIKQSSKEALVELRSILGVLRAVDEGAPRAPTPSLAHLDELVAGANAAGLDVRVDVDPALGDLADLPRPVDLAAYRIIQESLTNVARHAGRPDALVRARREGSVLVVEVLDEGGAVAARDHVATVGDATPPAVTVTDGTLSAVTGDGALPALTVGDSQPPATVTRRDGALPALTVGDGPPPATVTRGEPRRPASSDGSSPAGRRAVVDGSDRLPVDLPSGGNGIPGMRERAASVGGTLDVGPRPGQGFAVRAYLPLGART